MVVSFLELILTKEGFDIFRAINEIFRYIKKSTKKTPINKISTRSLGLEFKSDNLIKSRARKLLLKKCCLIIINNDSLLSQL